MTPSTPPSPEAEHSPSTQDFTRRRSSEGLYDEEPRRRWVKGLAIAAASLAVVVVLLMLSSAVALRHAMRASLPELDGTTSVAGLSSAVTVTRDGQGVPTLRASNLDDLLFAQGYVTASDRLFQMDALRRHGAGELAEILGPSLIEHDREQRILQLRSAADRAIAVLPVDQLHQLQVYANGVNAFIAAHDGSSGGRNTLPVEFHLLRYTPSAWTPRDSLLIGLVMSQQLSTEFPTKLNREALAAHLPASLLADLYPTGSWRDHPPTQTPADLTTPGVPVEEIPLDKTQSSCGGGACSLLPARAPAPAPAVMAMRGEREGASAHELLAMDAELRPRSCEGCLPGSNNWVVAGAHTASGAPLLSNDMHLGLTAPDIWYEASLHADGAHPLSVAGFTLPGVPFVIVGRNPFVAWGFTNSGADVQDVIIEHLRGSGDGTEYEHADHTWSRAGHQIEHIRVRAGHDVTLDVLTTTHMLGTTTMATPIISPLYKSEHRALALEWTIYDPSTVTSPMYSINTARDAASLVAAFAGFGSVSQNLVYADAQHIGYHLLGRIPIRGPAVQRPRAVQPFILPDATPAEDEDDESGDAQTSSIAVPHAVLASFVRTSGTVHAQGRAATQKITGSQEGSGAQEIPSSPTTPYTIGTPISTVPVDALDATQIWSGYIAYDALPSVVDPASGILATANSRIVTDDYPYFIANNWVDAYRVERINHLLENRSGLTAGDMLAIQTDTHSEFDLLVAQRLAYALDHSAKTKKDPRLQQAANLLRDWNGDVRPESSAAAIVASTRHVLWPMLLIPKLRAEARAQARAGSHSKLSASEKDAAKDSAKVTPQEIVDLTDLYSWNEETTALELILQHTPARWLPRAYANWDDFLTAALERGLKLDQAPANLASWSYGAIHPVDIAHPVFGSHSPISTLLGVATGSGLHPNGGDGTTIKQTGLHFGPSERFTADMSNAENTQANITTGESGNPASPWFLDQFLPWLNGTTFRLPLEHAAAVHSLRLVPK